MPQIKPPLPNTYTLTELQYAEQGEGPWKLYVYNEEGKHYRPKWFRKGEMKYPDKEITVLDAFCHAETARVQGREVRICDGGDMLVYHAKDGKVLYPPDDSRQFWIDAGAIK
jgi:hypothetical protein